MHFLWRVNRLFSHRTLWFMNAVSLTLFKVHVSDGDQMTWVGKEIQTKLVYFFIKPNLEKFIITLLAHKWIPCSEWVPSEWESKKLIKTSQLSTSISDGTHSLQRIYWWENNVMLNFSKSVLIKKQSHLHLGWPEGKYISSKFSFLGELFL